MKKIFALLLVSLWLTGCGQTGPLYLPPEKSTTQKQPTEKPVTKPTTDKTQAKALAITHKS